MTSSQTTASGGMTLITGLGRSAMTRRDVESQQELRRNAEAHRTPGGHRAA